mmetsp:Transcript_11147/g.20865  ORF Transcript_11147/g.20865 Transcript_11147/m.20865 type:complete len:145 (+) Transcript_11147:152-586(+)
MLIQIAKTTVEKQLHRSLRYPTVRFLTHGAGNNVGNISNVKFHQSDQSIDFFLLSKDTIDTDKEWDDPNMKFILSNSLYNKQMVNELDISQGLTISAAVQIEKHYCIDNSKQFVGGMGENDQGVWISAISNLDTLDYWDDIKGK